MPTKRKANRATKRSASPTRSLRCPDCGFRAAHAMGLGRHRSARHGVVSKRQQMGKNGNGWLSRQEAAKRARVHYNTIRQWERSGMVRSRRSGRSVLIDARSLARASTAAGTAATNVADVADVLKELERFYTELCTGLKRLLDAADASRLALGVQKKPKRRRKR